MGEGEVLTLLRQTQCKHAEDAYHKMSKRRYPCNNFAMWTAWSLLWTCGRKLQYYCKELVLRSQRRSSTEAFPSIHELEDVHSKCLMQPDFFH